MKYLKLILLFITVSNYQVNAQSIEGSEGVNGFDLCPDGIEFVVDGDFSSGTTNNFFSDQIYKEICNPNGPCVSKSICVGSDTHDKCSGKPSFTGDGEFLIVDGVTFQPTYYRHFWKQFLTNIQPNTIYTISFDVRDQYIDPLSEFGIRIVVDNQQVAITPDFGGSWTTFTYNWNSGTSSGNVEFALEITGHHLRDFAIDNISFKYCENCLAYGTIIPALDENCNYIFDAILQSNRQIIGYDWDFNDGSFSSEKNPTHSFALPGFYNVCLTVIMLDGDDCCRQTICNEFYITNCGELEELKKSNSQSSFLTISNHHQVEIYPNPNEGDFRISLNSSEKIEKPLNLKIYNLQGQLVHEEEFQKSLSNGKLELNIEGLDLSKGTYILDLMVNDEKLSLKYSVK